jgi:GTP-binding protein HflX
LHVIDVSDPDRDEKRKVVLDVLREIGAADHPLLTVYNKVDQLEPGADLSDISEDSVLVSAVTGEGLDQLLSEIVQAVNPVRA